MPNKTDLHEQIEQLTKERDSRQGLLKYANKRIAELKEERDIAQAKADKLFEENDQLKQNTPCINVALIHLLLEDMVKQLPENPNRFDFHTWASILTQELMADQAKDTRIEVDTLFIEPADLRIEYPTGDHDV